MKSARSQQRKPVAHITGESPLVEEFAELCASHGHAATVQWNEKPKEVPSGKSIRRSNTISPGTQIAVELTNTDHAQKKKNLQKLDRGLQKKGVLLTSSVTVTVAEQAGWIRHSGRLVGISALPTLLPQKLIEFAAGPSTTKESLIQAQDFFMKLGKEVSVVQDRIGMVLPRILCMIVNEAYFALQEGIASPQDVDAAMKLGTNYPKGPLEWGSNIGLHHVRAVLSALHDDLGEDRYRIAPLLKQVSAVALS